MRFEGRGVFNDNKRDTMRNFVWRSVMAISVFCIAGIASGAAAAGFYDNSCYMPAQLSCWGCAISCPLERTAVCTRGMNIWRGARWSCSFQPTCSCRRSIWSVR
jgi:hypothetical protein